jgi:hypothetical protein
MDVEDNNVKERRGLTRGRKLISPPIDFFSTSNLFVGCWPVR